jgi:hypothetical protein
MKRLTDTANGEIGSSKSIDHLFTIGDVMSKEGTKTKLIKFWLYDKPPGMTMRCKKYIIG